MRITDVIVNAEQLLTERMRKVATQSGLNITADMKHVTERMMERLIGPEKVMAMLDDLGTVANEIHQLDLGQQFWVHSAKHGISMGLKRYNANNLTFKTVVRGRPYDGDKPILEIPE